ncbi:beta-lactamase-like protein [Mrakia frigida]|uniref:beta-lactamase-like protein n=1 Tax=Mrakia frigida TaxID=29902 RepID=UPI003FCC07C7
MYIIVDDATQSGVVVDPYNAKLITAEAKKLDVKITTLLTTHHHDDHSGGNVDFLKSTPVPCFGGSSKVPGLTHQVVDNETFKIGASIDVKCIHTPCHTQDSICYFLQDSKTGERAVFTGDTLFTAGCGRFFEGTAAEMNSSLKKLMLLPDETLVYTGHEYTHGSAKFGAAVEPTNSDLQTLLSAAQKGDCVSNGYTIGDEKKWNVFIRTGEEEVRSATGRSDEVEVVQKLREMKNSF